MQLPGDVSRSRKSLIQDILFDDGGCVFDCLNQVSKDFELLLVTVNELIINSSHMPFYIPVAPIYLRLRRTTQHCGAQPLTEPGRYCRTNQEYPGFRLWRPLNPNQNDDALHFQDEKLAFILALL